MKIGLPKKSSVARLIFCAGAVCTGAETAPAPTPEKAAQGEVRVELMVDVERTLSSLLLPSVLGRWEPLGGWALEAGLQADLLTPSLRGWNLAAEWSPAALPRLAARLSWVQQLFPESQTGLKSLTPSIRWTDAWFHAELGFAWRSYAVDVANWASPFAFTPESFSPTLAYEAGVGFWILPGRWRIEGILGNQDNFVRGNLASLRMFVEQRWPLDAHAWLGLRTGIQPSGGGSYTANTGSLFAGLTGGVRL